MYKCWLLFYIEKNSTFQNSTSYQNKNTLTEIINKYQENWSHYEIKEIEFEIPKENWIIKCRWKYDPNHLYHRGGFKSKKEAEECWDREKNDYEVLIRIFKEPPPDVT